MATSESLPVFGKEWVGPNNHMVCH
jgi:hypothetical protein